MQGHMHVCKQSCVGYIRNTNNTACNLHCAKCSWQWMRCTRNQIYVYIVILYSVWVSNGINVAYASTSFSVPL